MNDRDDRILAHVGLYQLTLRCVLEELFFEGASCANVVQRLVASKQLQTRSGLPGKLSYYQLTRAEAKRRGLPESRARAPQNQALHTSLAALWFCCMAPVHRHRLEPGELADLFPESLPSAIHCVERTADSHRLIRLKVVDPASENSTITRSLRKTVFQTAELPGLRPWVQTGRYAFAVVTETAARVQNIRDLIAADEELSSLATFLVEQTPGVHTLKQAIHEQRANPSRKTSSFPVSDGAHGQQ